VSAVLQVDKIGSGNFYWAFPSKVRRVSLPLEGIAE